MAPTNLTVDAAKAKQLEELAKLKPATLQALADIVAIVNRKGNEDELVKKIPMLRLFV